MLTHSHTVLFNQFHWQKYLISSPAFHANQQSHPSIKKHPNNTQFQLDHIQLKDQTAHEQAKVKIFILTSFKGYRVRNY